MNLCSRPLRFLTSWVPYSILFLRYQMRRHYCQASRSPIAQQSTLNEGNTSISFVLLRVFAVSERELVEDI